MHEASIAQSLITLAEDYCRQNGHASISALRVRVGSLSGVLPDALHFAFDAMRAGTMAHGAELLIEEVRPRCSCGQCGGEFHFDGPYVLECPLCGASDVIVTGGRELDLAEMEVD